MFLEAMQLNATHGRKLDHQDISHIIIKAKDNFGISLQTVALHLYLPPREIQRIDKDVCYVSSTGQAYPLKRGLEHLRGTTLSTEQIDAVRTVRTCEGGRLFLELTTMIKNRLVEWTPLNLERAKVLRDLLTNVLNQQTPKSKKKAS